MPIISEDEDRNIRKRRRVPVLWMAVAAPGLLAVALLLAPLVHPVEITLGEHHISAQVEAVNPGTDALSAPEGLSDQMVFRVDFMRGAEHMTVLHHKSWAYVVFWN